MDTFRRFQPFAVLAVLVVMSGCSAVPAVPAVPPDQPWYIGMSRQQVFDALGDADSIFLDTTYYTPGIDNGVDAYFVYNDVHLSFRVFGSSVREITIVSRGVEWVFDNGLRVELTRAEAISILGSGYAHFPNTGKDFYQYADVGITFEVTNATDLVTEINITSNALHWDAL